MIKLTRDEYWLEEKALELVQSKMSEIEKKLDVIYSGEYAGSEEECENDRIMLEAEYRRLEAKADKSAAFLRHCFVGEESMVENPSFDYQLTEMKA